MRWKSTERQEKLSQCERCNIKGHFVKKCRMSPARVAQNSEREREDDSEDEGSQGFIGSVKYTSQIHETSSGIASPKKIHSTGRILFATGENALHTLGCVHMELSRGDTTIQEDVYIVRGVKTLLLGQPAIEKLGLIPNIPGAYRIRAVNSKQKEIPKLDTKDDVVKSYPNYSLDSVNLRASTLFDFEMMQNLFASTLSAGCPCR